MPLYYILFYVTFVKKLMVTWKGNMVVKIFMKLRLIFHGINFFLKKKHFLLHTAKLSRYRPYVKICMVHALSLSLSHWTS